MRKRVRWMLFLFALIVSLTALMMLVQVIDLNVGRLILVWLERVTAPVGSKMAAIAICLLFTAAGVLAMTYALLSERLRKTRVRTNETGTVDIGVDAIESIALNSAKLAQAGVKTAKARVYAAKNNEVRLVMAVVLYSDVEIQSQMAILQDRVKKDVERYTGIPVAAVEVKVNRVELIGAKIER